MMWEGEEEGEEEEGEEVEVEVSKAGAVKQSVPQEDDPVDYVMRMRSDWKLSKENEERQRGLVYSIVA